MSRPLKIKKDDSSLHYEIEILKVKLEQMEKRFEMMEQNMNLMERTHKAEMASMFQRCNQKHEESDSDESETASDDITIDPVQNTNPNKTIRDTNSKRLHEMFRRPM